MKHLLICLLVVNYLFTEAKEIQWSKGSCVLMNNVVVRGEFFVDEKFNLVLIRGNDDTAAVLPAHKIRSVFYYDEVADINRRFISVNESQSGLSRWSVFEVVVSGEITVCRKQKAYARAQVSCDRDDYEYYTKSGTNLVPLRNFAGKVYPYLRNNEKIQRYIGNNNLRLFRQADVIEIIKYANTLPKDNLLTALHGN